MRDKRGFIAIFCAIAVPVLFYLIMYSLKLTEFKSSTATIDGLAKRLVKIASEHYKPGDAITDNEWNIHRAELYLHIDPVLNDITKSAFGKNVIPMKNNSLYERANQGDSSLILERDVSQNEHILRCKINFSIKSEIGHKLPYSIKEEAQIKISACEYDISYCIPTNISSPLDEISSALEDHVCSFVPNSNTVVSIIPYSGKISVENRSEWAELFPSFTPNTSELSQTIYDSYMTNGISGTSLTNGAGAYENNVLGIMFRKNKDALSTLDPSSSPYKFYKMNRRPCYAGAISTLSMACLGRCKMSASESTDHIEYLANPYPIKEPTNDTYSIRKYISTITKFVDKYNESNFLFLPYLWSNYCLNLSWTKYPSGITRNLSTRKKCAVIIVNKLDEFAPNELTHLGFVNDAAKIPMAESQVINFEQEAIKNKPGLLVQSNNLDHTGNGWNSIGQYKSIKFKLPTKNDLKLSFQAVDSTPRIKFDSWNEEKGVNEEKTINVTGSTPLYFYILNNECNTLKSASTSILRAMVYSLYANWLNYSMMWRKICDDTNIASPQYATYIKIRNVVDKTKEIAGMLASGNGGTCNSFDDYTYASNASDVGILVSSINEFRTACEYANLVSTGNISDINFDNFNKSYNSFISKISSPLSKKNSTITFENYTNIFSTSSNSVSDNLVRCLHPPIQGNLYLPTGYTAFHFPYDTSYSNYNYMNHLFKLFGDLRNGTSIEVYSKTVSSYMKNTLLVKANNLANTYPAYFSNDINTYFNKASVLTSKSDMYGLWRLPIYPGKTDGYSINNGVVNFSANLINLNCKTVKVYTLWSEKMRDQVDELTNNYTNSNGLFSITIPGETHNELRLDLQAVTVGQIGNGSVYFNSSEVANTPYINSSATMDIAGNDEILIPKEDLIKNADGNYYVTVNIKNAKIKSAEICNIFKPLNSGEIDFYQPNIKILPFVTTATSGMTYTTTWRPSSSAGSITFTFKEKQDMTFEIGHIPYDSGYDYSGVSFSTLSTLPKNGTKFKLISGESAVFYIKKEAIVGNTLTINCDGNIFLKKATFKPIKSLQYEGDASERTFCVYKTEKADFTKSTPRCTDGISVSRSNISYDSTLGYFKPLTLNSYAQERIDFVWKSDITFETVNLPATGDVTFLSWNESAMRNETKTVPITQSNQRLTVHVLNDYSKTAGIARSNIMRGALLATYAAICNTYAKCFTYYQIIPLGTFDDVTYEIYKAWETAKNAVEKFTDFNTGTNYFNAYMTSADSVCNFRKLCWYMYYIADRAEYSDDNGFDYSASNLSAATGYRNEAEKYYGPLYFSTDLSSYGTIKDFTCSSFANSSCISSSDDSSPSNGLPVEDSYTAFQYILGAVSQAYATPPTYNGINFSSTALEVAAKNVVLTLKQTFDNFSARATAISKAESALPYLTNAVAAYEDCKSRISNHYPSASKNITASLNSVIQIIGESINYLLWKNDPSSYAYDIGSVNNKIGFSIKLNNATCSSINLYQRCSEVWQNGRDYTWTTFNAANFDTANPITLVNCVENFAKLTYTLSPIQTFYLKIGSTNNTPTSFTVPFNSSSMYSTYMDFSLYNKGIKSITKRPCNVLVTYDDTKKIGYDITKIPSPANARRFDFSKSAWGSIQSTGLASLISQGGAYDQDRGIWKFQANNMAMNQSASIQKGDFMLLLAHDSAGNSVSNPYGVAQSDAKLYPSNADDSSKIDISGLTRIFIPAYLLNYENVSLMTGNPAYFFVADYTNPVNTILSTKYGQSYSLTTPDSITSNPTKVVTEKLSKPALNTLLSSIGSNGKVYIIKYKTNDTYHFDSLANNKLVVITCKNKGELQLSLKFIYDEFYK